MTRLRVLVPVTGAFHGRLRVRRSSGTLDAEGLERVLSLPSRRAIALALQLQDAERVAVHVDKGQGEEVLREALAHGLDQGLLITGADPVRSDAAVRSATIAEVYAKHGPFHAVVGAARSEFGGFSGALAAAAGRLDLPCVVGAETMAQDGDGFRIRYRSLFGDYDLHIPRPCVVMAGDVTPSHPTAWGIHDAYDVRGILRVPVDDYTDEAPRTGRVRIEAVRDEATEAEDVDAGVVVRRLRSRGFLPARGEGP